MASSLLFKIKSTFDNAGFREAQTGFKDTIGLLGKMAVLATSAVFTFKNLGVAIALIAAKKVLLDLPNMLFGTLPAAAQAEAAFVRLKTQLGLLGLASKENLTKVKAFSDQTARSTQYSSEETQAAITIAIRRTGDLGKAIRQVSVAQDVAYATNRDLLTVTQLLNLAQAGNTRIIRQITNLRQADIAAAVRQGTLIDLLAKKFSGAASRGAETLATKQLILRNTTRQLKEVIESSALPINKFITDLRILGTNVLLQTTKGTKQFTAASREGSLGLLKLGTQVTKSISDLLNLNKTLKETSKTFTFDFEKQLEIATKRLGATFEERKTLLKDQVKAEELLTIAIAQGTTVLSKAQVDAISKFEFGQRKLQELLSEETEAERLFGKGRFELLQKLRGSTSSAGLFAFVSSAREAGMSIGQIATALENVNKINPIVANTLAASFGKTADVLRSVGDTVDGVKEKFKELGGIKGLGSSALQTLGIQLQEAIKLQVPVKFGVEVTMQTPPEAIQAAVKAAILGGLPGLALAFTSAVKRGSQEQTANGPAV